MIVNGGSKNVIWFYIADMIDEDLMTYINHVIEAPDPRRRLRSLGRRSELVPERIATEDHRGDDPEA